MPHRRPLILLVAVGFALRIALLAIGPARDIARAELPDSPLYIRLAQNIVRYGSFGKAAEEPGTIYEPIQQLRERLGQNPPRDAAGLEPEAMRTPGYPLFIAGTIALALPLTAVLAVQCILSAASIVLVYFLALRLLHHHKAALIAASVVALSPADIVGSNMLLSETLFTFLMLAGLVLAVESRRRGDSADIAASGGAGGLLGLAVLVRPVAMFLAPAIALWMVATDRRARSLAAAGVLLAASLIPVAGWCAHNQAVGVGYRLTYVAPLQVFSKTVPFMEMKARHLNNYPADWMACYHQQVQLLTTQIHPGEDVYDAMSRIARGQIAAQPLLYSRVLADNAVKFFVDHSLSDFYALLGQTYRPSGLGDLLLGRGAARTGPHDWTAISSALLWSGMNACLALLMFAGLIRLALRRQWPALLLLGGVMFYFLAATQAHGLERMRLPVLGLQAILCAAGTLPLRTRQATAARPADSPVPITALIPLQKAA